jgi:general secretion pathway protein A
LYEEYFGLSGKPFQLNPDPDFYFGSRGHKRAMAYLEYGLHQGEGFIVITGEVGAGKTTLVRNLIRRIPQETVSAAQIVSTQVDADDLLRLVAGGFGIPHEGLEKSALLMRLEDHFRYLHAEGRRALLIVDEAQNLSPRAIEELRMLSNFQIDTRSLVQSFLIGQPEFREVMQRPEMRQLKQRIIASYHLGPLDRSETQAYIEHRLNHVGWNGTPSFDPACFEVIHEVTAGVPRRINTHCDRLLLGIYLAEKRTINPQDIRDVSAELIIELGNTNPMVESVGTAQSNGLNAASSQVDHSEVNAQMRERLAQLEERVAMLEASTTTTYSMLKKLIRIVRLQFGDSSNSTDFNAKTIN